VTPVKGMPIPRQCLATLTVLGATAGLTAYLIARWPDGFRWFSIATILAFTLYETGRCLYRIALQDDGSACDREYF